MPSKVDHFWDIPKVAVKHLFVALIFAVAQYEYYVRRRFFLAPWETYRRIGEYAPSSMM